MDLNLTAEETKFRAELRGWLESNVPQDWGEGREKPLEESFPYLRAWQRKLYEGGWAAVSWPREYGGRSATLMEQSLFWEEMARVEAPPMANSLGLGLIGPTIIAYGTDEQKKRFIPSILSAEEIWCQGFSEPDAGSDLASLRTPAIEAEDDFVLSGQKRWGPGGQYARWCGVLARTDEDPARPKHKGISMLIVDMQSPGVDVRPMTQITGQAEFCELFLDDVKVPKENLLSARGDGWKI